MGKPIAVYLLSSFGNPQDDTHWASPYAALRRAFIEHPSDDHVLVAYAAISAYFARADLVSPQQP